MTREKGQAPKCAEPSSAVPHVNSSAETLIEFISNWRGLRAARSLGAASLTHTCRLWGP